MADSRWTLLPVSRFREAATDWDTINQQGPNLPFLDHHFFELLLSFFGTGREFVAIFGSESKPQLAAILRRQHSASWQTFQPSQAPLGAWVQCRGEQHWSVLAGLAERLPGFPISVGVTQQDPDLFARPAVGGPLRTLDYIDTARVNIVGSFEDYWAARGRNLRRNLKRQRSRLTKAGVSTNLRVIREPQQAGRAVEEYGELESKGWKASGGTALHVGNPQGAFYKKLMEYYCASGEGVVFQYHFGSDLVASDLCVARGGVLTILKTTYDETQKDSSPAMLMRQEMLEFLHRGRAFNQIEFYGRVMEWHTRLASEVRTLYHTTYYRFPWIARLADFRRLAATRIARLI